jgi:hypothetical protein
LVERARAGAIASIRSDSEQIEITLNTPENEISIIEQENDNEILNAPTPVNSMPKVYSIDSVEYNLEDVASVELMIAKLVENQAAKVSELQAELDAQSAKLDAQSVKADSAPVIEYKIDAEGCKAAVEAWLFALPVLKQDEAFAPDYSLSASQVKAAYLAKVAPKFAEKIDSASEEYINAFWDIFHTVAPDTTVEAKEAIEKSDEAIEDNSYVVSIAQKRSANFL